MLVNRGPDHALIYDTLIEEHRAMAAILERALATPASQPAERVAILAELARLLRAHAHAEETALFPVLDGSYELAHHVRGDAAEHAAIEALLRAIEMTPADAGRWWSEVSILRRRLALHFADEETIVFPGARCVIDDARAIELGAAYERDRDETAARLSH